MGFAYDMAIFGKILWIGSGKIFCEAHNFVP
jgi:hypothetical protein